MKTIKRIINRLTCNHLYEKVFEMSYTHPLTTTEIFAETCFECNKCSRGLKINYDEDKQFKTALKERK